MKEKPVFIGSNCPFDESNFVVLPISYEATVCYVHGTSKGPKAIIDASMQLESFDVELGFEIDGKIKIHTADELKPSEKPENAVNEIENMVSGILQKNKLPVILGGEHTVTVGAVRACVKRHKDLSVLQIDAHADLRDEFEGERYSHACVMRRIRENVERTVQVGVRDMGREENEYMIKEKLDGHVYGAKIGDNEIKKIIKQLSDNVYITIDLDGFDPSEVPAVGTPQPGGLHWEEVVGLLRKVAEKKNIVGFDVVELAPIEGQVSSNVLAAKLIYKIMGYCTLKKI